MIISEIIDTERRYIASLEILLSTYLPALENVVAARDLRLLFPAQLEPLVERHSNLLVKLEERMSDNTLFPGIVGDIFARLLKESNVRHGVVARLIFNKVYPTGLLYSD